MIQTHKEGKYFGVRTRRDGPFGVYARVEGLLAALENADDNSGLVMDNTIFRYANALVTGGPIEQSGTKELRAIETGAMLSIAAGDKVGDIKDCIRMALESETISRDWVVIHCHERA